MAKMSDETDFAYAVLTPEDKDDVDDLLLKYFYPRNDLALGFGRTPMEAATRNENLIKISIESGSSIGAREKATGRLVGVSLSYVITADNPTPATQINLPPILEAAYSLANVFQDPKVVRVLRGSHLCVHPDYGRRGIGYKLVQISNDVGAELGCQLADGLLTNPYAEKICMAIGYQVRVILSHHTLRDFNIDLSRMKYKQIKIMTKWLPVKANLKSNL